MPKITGQFQNGDQLPDRDYVDGDAGGPGLNQVLNKANFAPYVFETIAQAQAETFSEPECCIVHETGFFYLYSASSTLTDNGNNTILTPDGGGRLIAINGVKYVDGKIFFCSGSEVLTINSNGRISGSQIDTAISNSVKLGSGALASGGGDGSVAIGVGSLNSATDATNTIAIGYDTAAYTTDVYNSIYIGANVSPSGNYKNKEIAIGTNGKGSNTVAIGGSGTTNNYFYGEIYTKGTTDSSAYGLKIDDSSDSSLLSVRNDGQLYQSGAFVSDFDEITTNTTLTNSSKRIIVLNPSASGMVVTLPAAPEGQEYIFENISAFNVTIARNGNNIDGSVANKTITNGSNWHVKYFNATIQWRTLG